MRVLAYTIGDFLTDQAREFAFLKELGYEESSSEWTGHDALSHGTLFGESVFTAAPIVRYTAPHGRVLIAHDPSGEVQLTIETLSGKQELLEEIVRRKNPRAAGRYRGAYDAATETAGAVLARLATGMREYALDRLAPTSPPDPH